MRNPQAPHAVGIFFEVPWEGDSKLPSPSSWGTWPCSVHKCRTPCFKHFETHRTALWRTVIPKPITTTMWLLKSTSIPTAPPESSTIGHWGVTWTPSVCTIMAFWAAFWEAVGYDLTYCWSPDRGKKCHLPGPSNVGPPWIHDGYRSSFDSMMDTLAKKYNTPLGCHNIYLSRKTEKTHAKPQQRKYIALRVQVNNYDELSTWTPPCDS